MQLKLTAMVLASFLTALVFYPYLPIKMASHWDLSGQVNGYLPRFWGAFLMPLISLIVYGLYRLLPRIDPLKTNIAKFRPYFDRFILILTLFLYYLFLLTLFWNLGFGFNLIRWLSPAFSVLFYSIAQLTQNARPNWFIGIRTPWTLTDPWVWDRTHDLGAKLFRICSGLALIGIIFPQLEFWLLLLPLTISVVYLIIFSYREYSRRH